jgi:hypothetical protein
MSQAPAAYPYNPPRIGRIGKSRPLEQSPELRANLAIYRATGRTREQIEALLFLAPVVTVTHVKGGEGEDDYWQDAEGRRYTYHSGTYYIVTFKGGREVVPAEGAILANAIADIVRAGRKPARSSDPANTMLLKRIEP